MFHTTLHRIALAVFLLAPACAAETQNGGARYSLDDVPAAARAALTQRAGGEALTGVEHETERGQDVYEGAWMANGRRHEAKVAADGTLIEREHSIPAAEVPEAVRAAIARSFPTATGIEYVQKVFYVSGESVSYEIELRVDGTRREVLLSPTGQAVKDPTDEGEADDEDGDDEDDDVEHEGDVD